MRSQAVLRALANKGGIRVTLLAMETGQLLLQRVERETRETRLALASRVLACVTVSAKAKKQLLI
jgi:hypothetical protein